MEDFTQWPEIGRSDERICYVNPNDPTRCVKVSRKSKAKQSRREISYYRFLTKRGVPFTYIPKFYGVVEGEDYLGIEQELVRGSDGETPKDIYYYLRQPLSKEAQEQFWQAMNALKRYLIQYNVIPCDLVMSNLLVVKTGTGIQIKLIDGLGATEFIPLVKYVRFLGRKKIEGKWHKFLTRVVEPYFNQIQYQQS